MTERMTPILMLEGLYNAHQHYEFHWTGEQIEPVLMYKSEGYHFVPFFSRFILKPQQTSNGHYLCGLESSFRPATANDWQEWLDHLFQTGQWLDSISGVARKFNQGNVQVWIMVPYPFPHQKPFGKVYGIERDFRRQTDRLHAMQWWLQHCTERWAHHPCSDMIRLRGVVWGREGIPPFDWDLVKHWNKLVHEYSLESMWLPNYKAAFVEEWQDLGFDYCSLFPQYTGATEYGPEWLANACKFALVHQTGFQIIDGEGPRFSAGHFRKYQHQKMIYRQLGGAGPVVYRFPQHSLYDLYIKDRQRYDEVFLSL